MSTVVSLIAGAIPWLAIMALTCLVLHAWEREEHERMRAERAERERDSLLWGPEMVTLKSGARVEVFAWPARREKASWN